MNAFALDWRFTTDELLIGHDWYPALKPAGASLARSIADGPDEDFDVITLVDQKLTSAHKLYAKDLSGQPLPIRMRNGFARLFSPYL